MRRCARYGPMSGIDCKYRANLLNFAERVALAESPIWFTRIVEGIPAACRHDEDVDPSGSRSSGGDPSSAGGNRQGYVPRSASSGYHRAGD